MKDDVLDALISGAKYHWITKGQYMVKRMNLKQLSSVRQCSNEHSATDRIMLLTGNQLQGVKPPLNMFLTSLCIPHTLWRRTSSRGREQLRSHRLLVLTRMECVDHSKLSSSYLILPFQRIKKSFVQISPGLGLSLRDKGNLKQAYISPLSRLHLNSIGSRDGSSRDGSSRELVILFFLHPNSTGLHCCHL